MKIKVHTLKDALEEIIKSDSDIDVEKIEAIKAWPDFCGPELAAVSYVKTIKDGVIRIYSNSSSARTILGMQKKKIIEKYNEFYPNLHIADIQINRRG